MKVYDVVRNPADGKWYVVGYCGYNQRTRRQEWIAVSNAFADKQTAIAWSKRQILADRAAVSEMRV